MRKSVVVSYRFGKQRKNFRQIIETFRVAALPCYTESQDLHVTNDEFPPEHVIVHNRAIDNLEIEIIEVQCNRQTTYRKGTTRVINSDEGTGDSTTRSMLDIDRKNFIKYWNNCWIPSVSNDDISNKMIQNLQMNEINKERNPMLMHENNFEEGKYDYVESNQPEGTRPKSKKLSAAKNKLNLKLFLCFQLFKLI